MWFFRRRTKWEEPLIVTGPDSKLAFGWTVAVYIGTKKAAKKWIDTPYKKRVTQIQQTGKVGMEGLRRAYKHLIEHCDSMGEREELHLLCEDDKRFRAYSWVLRKCNGFRAYENYGKRHLVFRSPNYWYWQPNP
jgi:hypothetical protein